MDITWDEFSAVAPHLDEIVQLHIEKAVLLYRLHRLKQENTALHERLGVKEAAIERLEEDLRDQNGVHG